jgi:hypothetical protein
MATVSHKVLTLFSETERRGSGYCRNFFSHVSEMSSELYEDQDSVSRTRLPPQPMLRRDFVPTVTGTGSDLDMPNLQQGHALGAVDAG